MRHWKLSNKHIFVVPSWYPNKYSWNAGIFIREQALAIGQLRPDWRVAVSLWGQGDFTLTLKNPSRVFRQLIDYIRSDLMTEQTLNCSVTEYKKAVLHSSERLLGGRRNALLKANRVNLSRAIRDFKYVDVLHAHVSYPAGWLAMRLSEELGIPYIITEHMSPFPFPRFLDRDRSLVDLVREPLEKASEVVAVSSFHAYEISSYGLRRPIVVPNLVNEQVFKPLEQEHSKIGYKFFTLANMIPQKGIPDLLHGISLFLKDLHTDEKNFVAFRIGGMGFKLEEYRQLSMSLGLSPWITWLGYLTDKQVVKEFQQCDCFVLSSMHESFGIVYAQATACGRPIIATRSGGPTDIVTRENGVLIDVGNHQQLSEALHHIFKSKDNYNSSVIRQQFMERFSRPIVVQKLEHLYEKLAN